MTTTLTSNARAPLENAMPSLSRRQWLLGASASLLPATLLAQPSRSLELVQIVDNSAGQIDVSRDFLIGARAAWQEFNSKGGLRGRSVQHTVLEVDGSPASLKQALDTIRDLPNCVGLFGTAGARTANRVSQLLAQGNVPLAHIAPWLHTPSADAPDRTFNIFAPYKAQIEYALKSLATVGVADIGAVYADPQEQVFYQPQITRIATDLKLRLQNYTPQGGNLRQLGQQMTAQAPIILLFIGSTLELAQFAQGLDGQDRMRYVIGLSDVNMQTLHQLGRYRQAAVVTTQVVPMTTASLPLVRNYRTTLARLFDEPPAPLSLSGYVAARYAQDVLTTLDSNATRAQVLQAFQKRAAFDMGGYYVSVQGQRDSVAYVTQSMLTADGRILG